VFEAPVLLPQTKKAHAKLGLLYQSVYTINHVPLSITCKYYPK